MSSFPQTCDWKKKKMEKSTNSALEEQIWKLYFLLESASASETQKISVIEAAGDVRCMPEI